MRIPQLAATVVLYLLASATVLFAEPTEKLAEAKGELAEGHAYSADSLLQDVINDEGATSSQVEEALVMQCLIYYGDVCGAALVMPSVTAALTEPHDYSQEIGQQLLLARRAFFVAAKRYLSELVIPDDLSRLEFTPPSFTEADLKNLQATLGEEGTMKALLSGYATDPSPAKGLLARANQFGLYLGAGALVPGGGSERELGDIRAAYTKGIAFDRIAYLDWLATVSLDMHSLINEPGGPDLIGLSKQCNSRLLDLAPDGPGNPHVANAQARAGKYPQ